VEGGYKTSPAQPFYYRNMTEELFENPTKENSSKNKFEKKISKMSFEDAMTRLEEIVEILSSQKINLDSMIELYAEGAALKDHCAARLEDAKMKIETISKK
jgi:exodeoxyribonuclease VII small subunit